MTASSAIKYVKITVPICGVSCWGTDGALIEYALTAIDGVNSVYVNPAMEMAYLQYDPATCGVAEFAAAIERIGFHVGKVSFRSF
jgi:copper chaperone CopZ